MPKPTFLNLPDAKKAKILMAAKKELSETPFDVASINKIIKDAGISRGSFYMYFEDKYDLILVLLDEFQNQYQSFIIEAAKGANGSLVEVMLCIHDFVYQAFRNKENCGILKHFLLYSSSNLHKNDSLMKANPLFQRVIGQFLKLIDHDQFISDDPEYIKNVVEISFAALRDVLRRAIIDNPSMEDSRSQLKKYMDILQQGYSRKEEKSC